MKLILSVYPIHAPISGIGRYTWELASRLPNYAEITDIRYFNLGRWVTDLDSLLQPPSSSSSLRSVLIRSKLAVGLYGALSPMLFARQLKKYKDHIYHSPNFFLPPFPGKSIATFHDISVYRHPEYHQASQIALTQKEIPKALERADHLIAISQFTKQEIVEVMGYPKDRISVIYNGVSEEYHPRTEQELKLRLAKYALLPKHYFLSIATIEPRKNIDTILQAYQNLPGSVRKHFPLVIAGASGWKSQATHERIQRMSSSGQVRYLGYLPEQDLPILYAGATAKIFIPFYEGFGLPALEAMASATPVIASTTSSLPEVVGDAGYCVSPHDVSAITTNMELLADRSEDIIRRIDMGIAIAKNLTWQRCVASTVQLYQRAVD